MTKCEKCGAKSYNVAGCPSVMYNAKREKTLCFECVAELMEEDWDKEDKESIDKDRLNIKKVVSLKIDPETNGVIIEWSDEEKEKVNLTDRIIAYEQDELNDVETIHLFSELVKNGMAWSLQGHYGRTAAGLIEAGYLEQDGTINEEKLESLE